MGATCLKNLLQQRSCAEVVPFARTYLRRQIDSFLMHSFCGTCSRAAFAFVSVAVTLRLVCSGECVTDVPKSEETLHAGSRWAPQRTRRVLARSSPQPMRLRWPGSTAPFVALLKCTRLLNGLASAKALLKPRIRVPLIPMYILKHYHSKVLLLPSAWSTNSTVKC